VPSLSCSCETSPEDLDWELLCWDSPSTKGVFDLEVWELLSWDSPSTTSVDFGLGGGMLGLDGDPSSITNLSVGYK
jgi:hypothetical protein